MTDRSAMTTAATGVTSDEVRRHNLSLLLDQLHRYGPRRRSTLTHTTGLNRSTVGDLVAELVDLGIAVESAAPAQGPGRPSPIVSVSDTHLSLSIAIGVYSIRVATVGLGGRVIAASTKSLPSGGAAPESIIREIGEMAARLTEGLGTGRQVEVAGASITGICRSSDGFLHTAPNLGWTDLPLGEMLEATVGRPVKVGNDADLGAMAEHARGAGVGASNLIYLSGEAGIGAGVILGGQSLRGAAGYALEAGHMLVNPSGQVCGCGATGCWETEAGEAALFRAVGEDAADGLAAHTSIIRRLTEGDPSVTRGVDGVARWLALGIGDLLNLFNPEIVILGGFLHDLFPHIRTTVEATIPERALAAPLSLARIVPSLLGADANLLGAAELAFESILRDPASLAA